VLILHTYSRFRRTQNWGTFLDLQPVRPAELAEAEQPLLLGKLPTVQRSQHRSRGFQKGPPFLLARSACRAVLVCRRMTRPPDRRLLTYLAGYDPHISHLTLALREVVLEEAPEAIESIVKGYAVAIGFSFTGKPLKDGFCHIVTYSSHVNLGFNRGALLPDPNGVLAGTGKSIRHMTIRNQSELDRAFVRRYLQAAIEQISRPPPQRISEQSSRRAPNRGRRPKLD
jgi:hypothetical protein